MLFIHGVFLADPSDMRTVKEGKTPYNVHKIDSRVVISSGSSIEGIDQGSSHPSHPPSP